METTNHNQDQGIQETMPFQILPGLFKWERISIYIIAGLSFFAALSNVKGKDFSSLDIFMGIFFEVLLNSAIMYFVFRLCNGVYKKIKK